MRANGGNERRSQEMALESMVPLEFWGLSKAGVQYTISAERPMVEQTLMTEDALKIYLVEL